MDEKILLATKREVSTKGAVKQLRRDGYVPGIYYSKGKEQVTFSCEEVALKRYVYTSETNIIQLTFEGEEPLGCIVKDVQFDPVTDRIVHVDLMGVTLGQTLQLEVPVNFVGTAAGLKEGGILQELLHKLDIECLPRHIPQNLEIDITDLEIGDSINVKDLNFENIKILNNEDAQIVSVVAPKAEEAEVSEDEENGEAVAPEVISKGKAEEE